MEEFIVKFKVQFHGTKYDNLIAKELGTNNYRDFGHISPFEYFVNTVSRAKDSTINYSESYICEAMSRQFGDSVEHSCKIQNVVKTKDFLNLLERIGENTIRRELRIANERGTTYGERKTASRTWERGQRLENQENKGYRVQDYGRTTYKAYQNDRREQNPNQSRGNYIQNYYNRGNSMHEDARYNRQQYRTYNEYPPRSRPANQNDGFKINKITAEESKNEVDREVAEEHI
jgi:hypothetical protein